MSTFQRLTLIGLYNHDPDLFKHLTLPEAYDRQTFLDVLLLDQGEKRVAYPEPEFFGYAVGVWSRKWAASLERIAAAMTAEYNPLHNYDRYEEWEDHEKGEYKNNLTNSGEDVTQHSGDDVTTHRGEDVTRHSGEDVTRHGGQDVTRHGGNDTTTNTGSVTTTETGTRTEQTNNMTTERTVSAFNESAYQPDEKNTVNGSVVTTPNTTQTVTPNTTETVTHGATETVERGATETVKRGTTETVERGTTETLTHGATETLKRGTAEDGSGNDARDATHKGHLYGNIGVTTSVQMLTAEVDARKNYNMYAIAAELFADDLLLMLY